MISWLLDASPESDVDSLAMRMLNVNFVALHTTTKVFVHALYHLAANPQFISALRNEAEANLGRNTQDWTKEGLSKCLKMDSFFKETLRFNVFGSITLPRLAVKDFAFSDGTRVGKGYYVATAGEVVQRNPTVYPYPDQFKPFRFVSQGSSIASLGEGAVGEQDDERTWPHRMTSTSESFIAFGGGRHLWRVSSIFSSVKRFANEINNILQSWSIFRVDGDENVHGVSGVTLRSQNASRRRAPGR